MSQNLNDAQIREEIILVRIGGQNLHYLRLANKHTKQHVAYVSNWILKYAEENDEGPVLIYDTRYCEEMANPIEALAAARNSMMKLRGLVQLGLSKPARLVANSFSGIAAFMKYVFMNPESAEDAYEKMKLQLPESLEGVSHQEFMNIVDQPVSASYKAS